MSRIYSVKEMYFTLQGEGAQTGRAAVFLRFAGCNLWTGREQDRGRAVCDFCDTDFIGTDGPGGGKFGTPASLAAAARQMWDAEAAPGEGIPYVICTGGEPLLQLDAPLIAALHEAGLQVGVETNGTVAAPTGLDWICVSPKADAPLVQTSGDELKLVYFQQKARPERFAALSFAHFFLQPMDGPEISRHTAAAIEYCRRHPQWRLSLQIHKLTGIP
ncbi:7-carboxy-7-deazaguanine synthase [Aquisalinus flavus]|uniref:7-carboxy-7-deazaguanine synthase n=1 Tax=Aquisalinus flavus TaxID=1526572 RepID=A0A8J2V1A1_9PROT|nr:7-carboxy-7-deazaguanine synthase [Aquisalinus flavus]MBD0426721.1 7-carboxy-7-deazaguanine synthase [Aquisalinus flavus]UNE46586.1 7-carboxy-7-deazaguanine synthase [Aquisalinus flavus]GGC95454.1 7-carboxy-7-deazaguanine synthase [Aquisalinus flavus]